MLISISILPPTVGLPNRCTSCIWPLARLDVQFRTTERTTADSNAAAPSSTMCRPAAGRSNAAAAWAHCETACCLLLPVWLCQPSNSPCHTATSSQCFACALGRAVPPPCARAVSKWLRGAAVAADREVSLKQRVRAPVWTFGLGREATADHQASSQPANLGGSIGL